MSIKKSNPKIIIDSQINCKLALKQSQNTATTTNYIKDSTNNFRPKHQLIDDLSNLPSSTQTDPQTHSGNYTAHTLTVCYLVFDSQR